MALFIVSHFQLHPAEVCAIRGARKTCLEWALGMTPASPGMVRENPYPENMLASAKISVIERMPMNDRTFETLELKALIELAARHVQTPPGRARMLKLRPSTARAEIHRELDLTGECVAYLNVKGRFGLSGIEDLDPILAELHIEGARLEPRQILALERLLLVGGELRGLVRGTEHAGLFPHLLRITSGVPDVKALLSAIHGKILPNGEIDDNASPELRIVRKDLTERRHRIHRTLESILRGQTQAVQEEIITFRNGRFVIPVRTDSRGRIPGVMHGLSSSGQTTFVEPLTVIDQNNDLVRLREQEEIEESRILLSITQSLRENLDPIRTILSIVTELDVAQAKALFANEFQCVAPQVSEGKQLAICDARHILLDRSLQSAGAKSVPISLELDENHPILIISGPNAGGKTVALKTLGLLSLMAQMGFHVPAREAQIPIFDQVFADIGDQQSIAANLSTFTAHMRNIAEMARQVKPSALILLDEVGTGTDPDEGAAMAVAIVEYFRRIGSITIASTHYPRLKMWASQTTGVRNASVEFDEHTLRPTYRLILGIAGASSGLEIARRMLVPEDILATARTLIEPSHAQAREYMKQLKETLDAHESLRAALEEERAAVAEKYSRAEADFAKREESRRAEFDETLARIVEEFKGDSERAARKIKDRIEAARIKRAIENQAAELRYQSAKLRPTSGTLVPANAVSSSAGTSGGSEAIAEGDGVRIHSIAQIGTVESIREGIYVVQVGSLRYRTERNDIERVGNAHASAAALSPAHSIADSSESAVSELKVIGLTADEALDRVDKFLDQAFYAGLESVRVIHGHGKGILRKAITKFLTDHSQVERFSPAPPDKGGGGATIIEIKK
jgi:DNA mismatch repair protein MutS2